MVDIFFKTLKLNLAFCGTAPATNKTHSIKTDQISLYHTWFELFYIPPNPTGKHFYGPFKKNCDRADYLTFISNFAYQDAKNKQLNISDKKYRIIYNGVAVEKPKITAEENTLWLQSKKSICLV
jgi:hypothetical protein